MSRMTNLPFRSAFVNSRDFDPFQSLRKLRAGIRTLTDCLPLTGRRFPARFQAARVWRRLACRPASRAYPRQARTWALEFHGRLGRRTVVRRASHRSKRNAAVSKKRGRKPNDAGERANHAETPERFGRSKTNCHGRVAAAPQKRSADSEFSWSISTPACYGRETMRAAARAGLGKPRQFRRMYPDFA